MKLTLRYICDKIEPFKKIMDKELRADISFKLAKISALFDENFKLALEQRNKLVQKYGEEQKDKNWKVKDENTDAFQEEINKLLETQIDIPGLPVKISDLQIDVSPSDLGALITIFE